MGRIVDYPEITTLSAGDYLIVDNAEGGTKKVTAQSVAGTVDPTPTESSTNAVSSGGVWTSLNDISEEFEALRSDAYDVYPKGIASGDIVQFETGADNVPLSDLTGYIYPTMSGSGMPSRTNIRTISGPDDINIYQRNKNLIEQITYQAEPETVYLGVQNSSNLTMFFKAGDYRITVNIVGGSTVEPYWSVGSTATHSEYMHLDNDTNVSIYVYDADGISASDIESFQVEVGTEATDYVEFEGDITNVVLPTDRGTIYSGRVALTSGKVYIDTVIYERNSSTMNNTEDKPGWAYTGLQTYDVAIGTFDDVIYWPNGDVRCTNVNVGSTYSVEVENEDYSLILPRDVYNMSQSQWISAGVDIQILVKLNTPIEIDIDPVEVRSLYGFNTYYCNSGKIGVIFGMDLAKHITSKTSEVEDEMNKKIEKAFATDTASGAVATFTDGADDIPMKSVKVAIEPVQDLHGQESPYPAGGSRNLFKATPYGGDYNMDVGGDLKNYQTMHYEITSDGRIVIDIRTAWRGRLFATDALTAGDYACKTYMGSEHGRLTVYITDANLVVKSVVYNQSSSGWSSSKVVSVSDGDRIAVFIGSNTVEKLISEFQVESGTTVHDVVPFENICPISGWTGAQVVRTGKNLFDIEGFLKRDNVTYEKDGSSFTFTPSQSMYSNPWRFAKKDSVISASVQSLANITSSGIKLRFLNDSGTTVFTLNESTNSMKNIVASRIRVDWNTNGQTRITAPQIEFGAENTSYEPYQGATYSITFPSEAGTVYGGELDVTNGVLTVERAMVDLGTLNWRYTATYDGRFYTDLPVDAKLIIGVTGSLCSRYAPTEAGDWQRLLNYEYILRMGLSAASRCAIAIRDNDYTDPTAFKTAMNGVQLVYELAEPIAYHLTPTEIKSLLGDNNIWADAGNTEVTYRADTKLYIDKKIAEVINALS